MTDEFVVAVPACNEAETIEACLRSVDAAACVARRPTHVVVAADSCTDETAAVARSVRTALCRVTVVTGRWGGAGAARQAAVEVGLAAAMNPSEVWIANTDADTRVPETWLAEQARLAASFDAVAGVVDLDPDQVGCHLFDRFRATYRLDGDRHHHVHGANLGLRAVAYRAVGGWCPRTIVGEDHGLWNRLVAHGCDVIQTTRLCVITSGRTTSRVDDGFATDLCVLNDGAGVRPSAVVDTMSEVG